jgi:ribosomal-protein-alanine N-acetyltransferase
VTIRTILTSDIDEILIIQSASTEASQWSHDSYARIAARESPTEFMWVACNEIEQVNGFLVAREVAGESEILNLAVHPDYRRRGVAAALLDHGMDHAQSQGAARCFLEVRRSNTTAIHFYRSHNFWPTGIRPCYYSHPKEDAILLSHILSPGPAEMPAR